MSEASEIVEKLGLEPHPEGGWYRQTWVSTSETGRPAGTCIYFLLKEGERSHWHRVDATEIWHFYGGSPLTLSISKDDHGPVTDYVLGPDFATNQVPQLIVPLGHWQTAFAHKGWALVGCTVSPGFQFEGFELAPSGFDIPRTR